MKRSRVAKRYAQAFFEAAQDEKVLEQVESDMNLLAMKYDQVDEFKHLIDSPVISNEVKLKTFDELFRNMLNPLTLRFISLLIQKNREGLLPAIATHFHEFLDDFRGIVRGTVRTVIPLSEEQIRKLQVQLEAKIGKKVVLQQRVEEGLLGGVVVTVQDIVFDGSLRQQLNKLKYQLSSS